MVKLVFLLKRIKQDSFARLYTRDLGDPGTLVSMTLELYVVLFRRERKKRGIREGREKGGKRNKGRRSR